MADSHVRSLNASAASWAVERALRYAVATTAVALLFAGLSSGEDAERFATAAYLAAFFTVMMLFLRRVLPAPPPEAPKGQALFPVVFGFSVVVVTLLMTAALLASVPSAEGLLIAGCITAIGLAVMARSGRISAAGGALVAGGTLSAALRCIGVGLAVALAIAALLPAGEAGDVASVAYRVAVVGMVVLAIALIAPTPVGRFAARCFAGAVTFVRNLSYWNLTAGVSYGAVAAVVSFVAAGTAPAEYAGALNGMGYAALLFCAVVIATRWRLQLAGYGVATPIRFVSGTPLRLRDLPARVATNFAREKLWDLARFSQWAAGTAVAAFIIAAPMAQAASLPFVTAGYSAACFAALTLGVALWRQRTGDAAPSGNRLRPGSLSFIAGSLILALAAAEIATNAIATKFAVLLCLCWIFAAIRKRSDATP